MNRIMRVLSIMLVAVVMCAAAMADAMPTVGVQKAYLNEDNQLQVVVHSTIEEADDSEACRVELDQQRMAITDIDDYWKTELGTSWLFLTDTASVSTNKGQEPVTALLEGLISNMDENDNAAVISTGKTFSDIRLTEDKNSLLAEVKEMRMDSNVNTLYATIRDAVVYLDMQADVRPHASLVIISSGATDSEEGMTISELQKIVEDANITVYTVAFSTESSDALNDYTSLSRSGCGGMSIKMPTKSNAGDIVKQIRDNERQFRLMTAELPEAAGQKLTVYVPHNDKYLEDSITLNVKLQENIAAAIAAKQAPISEASAEPNVEPTPEISMEPTAEPTAVPGPTIIDTLKENAVMLIIGGVCVVLLIVVIVLLASGRKQKPAANQNQGENTPIPDAPPVVIGETEIDEPRSASTQITLMQVGGAGNVCFRGELKEQLIVGRQGDIAIDLNDPKISRQHFILRSVAGMVIIENMGRNGTRVNNVEIRQAVEVHQQDIITIGNTSFKISWMRY